MLLVTDELLMFFFMITIYNAITAICVAIEAYEYLFVFVSCNSRSRAVVSVKHYAYVIHQSGSHESVLMCSRT
jgi:hypothetical protein